MRSELSRHNKDLEYLLCTSRNNTPAVVWAVAAHRAQGSRLRGRLFSRRVPRGRPLQEARDGPGRGSGPGKWPVLGVLGLLGRAAPCPGPPNPICRRAACVQRGPERRSGRHGNMGSCRGTAGDFCRSALPVGRRLQLHIHLGRSIAPILPTSMAPAAPRHHRGSPECRTGARQNGVRRGQGS